MAGGMTERLFLYGLPVVITWALVVQRVSYGEEEDVDRTVKALEAAFDTWVSRLKFACTFDQSTTTAETFEDALQEKYVSPPQWQVRGEYAMADKLIRHAITAVRERRKPAQNPKGYVPVDFEIHQYARNAQTGVLMRWRPGRAYFLPVRLDQTASRGTLADWQTMLLVLSPLMPWGDTLSDNPIRRVRESISKTRDGTSANGNIKWNVHRPDRDSIILQTVEEVQKPTGERVVSPTSQYVYSVKGGTPLITMAQMYSSRRDGGTELREIYLFEEFVSVTGGQMASKVRRLLRLADGKVAVTIWKSEDLGRRRPQSSDFLVVVPVSDLVDCVRSSSIPAAVRGKWNFDIGKMSPDDFDPSCIGGAPKGVTFNGGLASDRGSWIPRWWLWIAVAVVSVTLVGYITYRLRRKSTEGST